MCQPILIRDYCAQRVTAGLSDHRKVEIARCPDRRRRDPGHNVRSVGSCARLPRERGGDVLPRLDLVGAVVARCSDNAIRPADALISLFPANSTPMNCPELSRRFCTARATQARRVRRRQIARRERPSAGPFVLPRRSGRYDLAVNHNSGVDKTRTNAVTCREQSRFCCVRRALHANPDLAPQRRTVHEGRT
jgi:hypothetical protein